MTTRGGAFYDAPGRAGLYLGHRHGGVDSPNVVMEEPAFLDELGALPGLRVLDLGCGDAAVGRTLLDGGCASYLGLDGSAEMVAAAAERLAGTAGRVERADIEDFSAPDGSFDLVISRMALHYVADLGAALSACARALAPGGRVLFTVAHPVITSHDARPEGRRTSWLVDDYFRPGPRERDWLGAAVTWHHRTIEEQVAALTGAGFALTALRECAPRPERFHGNQAELARRRRVPLFLLLAGRLPDAATPPPPPSPAPPAFRRMTRPPARRPPEA
ncbi:class I SAM-dependent methyltransferase [Nonomuraea sp. NBC_01738]|uniref:class I SAM-dependent methyltransferase n=1 Tax=Nonomuraea sp. NBC_01738 TaxID=2976003 RepID=UPI002E14021B|nr:class I SAM-dependent methyltransferase [Nonomuraea sp. NBC_01738]